MYPTLLDGYESRKFTDQYKAKVVPEALIKPIQAILAQEETLVLSRVGGSICGGN